MTVTTYENLNLAQAANLAGFKTLLDAARKAGLYELLASGENITVFAPDDNAFNILQKSIAGGFLAMESKEHIADILKYHIVSSELNIDMVTSFDEIEMMNGETVEISMSDHIILVNDSRITQANIKTKNGIIHAIDKVLMPE